MKIKIKKLTENARLPYRATEGSAGMDLYTVIDEPVLLEPHKNYAFPTGLAIELPSNDFVALVYARSGLATKCGIAPTNCVGVIDSDYRGEIIVNLMNHTNTTQKINPGDRIAQLIIAPVIIPEIEEVDKLSDTSRGTGGFGSTGKN